MADTKDRKALEQELRSQIGTADWPVLQIHAKSGNMIVLNQSVDLLTFAIAVAANDTEVVSKHIQEGAVSKPSAEEQARFKGATGEFFQFVIVAPFILVKPVGLNDRETLH
ncbi:MAG: DUF2288 family protein [Bradymonadia bacterium]